MFVVSTYSYIYKKHFNNLLCFYLFVIKYVPKTHYIDRKYLLQLQYLVYVSILLIYNPRYSK